MVLLCEATSNATAVQILVWSDVAQHTLTICQSNQSFVNGASFCPKPGAQLTVLHEDVTTTDGLAVDWVHALLFRTDTDHDKLFVLDLRTSRERVLLSTGLDRPRAVAVDPSKGLVFWTDWGTKCIERAGMDGRDRHVRRTPLKVDR